MTMWSNVLEKPYFLFQICFSFSYTRSNIVSHQPHDNCKMMRSLPAIYTTFVARVIRATTFVLVCVHGHDWIADEKIQPLKGSIRISSIPWTIVSKFHWWGPGPIRWSPKSVQDSQGQAAALWLRCLSRYVHCGHKPFIKFSGVGSVKLFTNLIP